MENEKGEVEFALKGSNVTYRDTVQDQSNCIVRNAMQSYQHKSWAREFGGYNVLTYKS